MLGGFVSPRLLSISWPTAKVKAPRPAPDPYEIEAEGDGNGRNDRLVWLQREQRGIIHDQVDVARNHHRPNRKEAGQSRQKPQNEEYADANLSRRHNPHIE